MTSPVNITTPQQLRQFIAKQKVTPGVTSEGGAKKIDANGDSLISRTEFEAHYADTVTLSVSADQWQEVAGDDNELSTKECTDIAAEDSPTVEPEIEMAAPVLIDAAALRRAYIRYTRTARASLPPKDVVEQGIRDALEDNVIDKAEFEEIFDTDLTDAAWKAFTGLDSTKEGLSLNKMIGRLKDCGEFNEAIGQSWHYFIRCRNITIVPDGEALATFFQGLTGDQKFDFYENFLSEGQEDKIDALYEKLLETDPTKDREDAVRLYKKTVVEQMDGLKGRDLRGLMYRYFYEMYREMDERELDVPNLTDPLVAARFAETCFKNYLLTEGIPVQGELNSIEKLGETLEEVREICGPEIDETLGLVDPKHEDFDVTFDRISGLVSHGRLSTEEKQAMIEKYLAEIRPIAAPIVEPPPPEETPE